MLTLSPAAPAPRWLNATATSSWDAADVATEDAETEDRARRPARR